MSFQLNVAINDSPFQKKTVTASTTVGDLHADTILIWKDTSIVYDVTDASKPFGPSSTLAQLGVTAISMLYVYTTDFPCPSGDLRSIVPAQVRLISQFASQASKLFNQGSSGAAAAKPRQEAVNPEDVKLYSRQTLENPKVMKMLAEKAFFDLKQDPQKYRFRLPELAERFSLNAEQTFKEFERLFREFVEDEIHKDEILKNNPNSEEAKMLMEAKKNRDLIDEQYMHSVTHHPEDMIPVTMLYINLTINGVPVKAFIDSGAQKSIMSMACAERCGLNGLIDRRFSGMARGVGGTEKIEGKIHLCDVKVEDAHFLCPFEVMARREMDLLVGLNVLRKHACCINLKTQRLEFGNGTTTPFLQSQEIDSHLLEIRALPDDEMEYIEQQNNKPGPSK